MSYTYIIIDDNQESVLKTKAIIARFQNFHFLGAANNYEDGLNLILQFQPKIIFLEINPENKGSNLSLLLINELYRYLKQIPKIIVTTRDTSLAFEAIKYEVIDYLIKPLDVNELRKSILRFEKSNLISSTPILEILPNEVSTTIYEEPEIETPFNDEEIEEEKDEIIANETSEIAEEKSQKDTLSTPTVEAVVYKPEKPLVLCVKSYGDYRYIDAKDIQYFQADNNSTDIYLHNGEMITAFKTLKLFEEILPKQFLRIHNSYIVNIDYVSRIHTGNTVCYIKNSTTKLPFSKSYKQNIDEIIATIASGNYIEI